MKKKTRGPKMSEPKTQKEAESFRALSCPFCGAKKLDMLEADDKLKELVRRVHWLYCKGCHASGPVKETVLEAAEAWNRRTKL